MRLTVVADPADNALRATAARLGDAVRARGLDDLVDRLAAQSGVRTLDIVAHTDAHGLLRIGDTTLDPTEHGAALDDLAVELARLGAAQVRLLGCRSARGRGASAIIELADRLAVRVFGATTALHARCFDSAGFLADYDVLLADDRALRRQRQISAPSWT